ncbi:RDD family protein [Aquimarina aggregata]|uniref:RDD family protein n=1 Tax=Aquimarina aggregata TaxID=1642818 RepID=UPI002490B77F|nr:RDD family protein [Aquimarina aggregata]
MEDNSIGNEISEKISTLGIITKRFLAFIIDLMLLGFIGGIFGLFIDKVEKFRFISDFIFYILMALFLIRDLFFRNGSIGKKILNLKIVSDINGFNTNKVNKILRNITMIIWPIELIILLISNKRLSDYILKINVIEDNL